MLVRLRLLLWFLKGSKTRHDNTEAAAAIKFRDTTTGYIAPLCTITAYHLQLFCPNRLNFTNPGSSGDILLLHILFLISLHFIFTVHSFLSSLSLFNFITFIEHQIYNLRHLKIFLFQKLKFIIYSSLRLLFFFSSIEINNFILPYGSPPYSINIHINLTKPNINSKNFQNSAPPLFLSPFLVLSICIH